MTGEEIREATRAIARRCRHVIQGCLREEEWPEADKEFARIVREILESKGNKR